MTKHAAVFITLILLLLNSGFVYAQESYRTEISANYFHCRDQEDDESNVYSAQARLYFTPVNTSNHPLAEASFLERIGSVTLLGGQGRGEGSSFDSEGPFYGASLRLSKPEIPVTLHANYTKTKADFEIQEQEDQEAEVDAYGFGVGYFFQPALLGEIQYSHSSRETTFSGTSFTSDSKSDFYGASARYVKEKPDGTAYSIAGTVGIERFDDDDDSASNTIVSISGDYYFNRMVSLGAGYTFNTGDDKDDEGNTFNVNLNAFLNQHLSFNAGFTKFFADDPEGEDAESFNVAVTTRF